MKVAVVGATGLVGSVMLEVLAERRFPVSELLPVASERSVGKPLRFRDQDHLVVSMEEAVAAKPTVAIFSAGGATAREWAPRFAAAGTTVIDNSSAWRMDPSIKLVVPEVNADVLTPEDKIIANPNCSTIQMVVVLEPLHRLYGVRRLVISTYQSITGTGVKAVKQYQLEQKGFHPAPEEMAYPHPIFENCLPHIDVFLENGYTKEEMKMVNETRKIMRAPDIGITATTVRVPVLGGHSESVNVTLEKPFDLEEVRKTLSEAPGVVVVDAVEEFQYPMPLFARHKDEVFVGRIRRDDSVPHGLNLWIVADNLRKGAATNAVQIAEYLLRKQWIG